jgi:hypothetical protein
MFDGWVGLMLGIVLIIGRRTCASEVAELQERMWGVRFAREAYEPGFVWGGLMFLCGGLWMLLQR